MKSLKFKVLVVLFASFALISGCKDDTAEVVSPFVGNYTITKAAVTEAFSLSTTIPNVSIPVAVGTPITQNIQSSLLSSVSCSTADKAWVELRKDKSMYMSCEGANAINAGTWQEVDATTLLLNMNSVAVKPNGFALTVTNVVKNSTGLTGKTSVPMPKEMFAAGLAALGMTIGANPPLYVVSFSIDFTKK